MHVSAHPAREMPRVYDAPAGRGSSRATDSIDSVQNCRLPSFWRSNPELWLLQVKAAFQTLRVHSDETKYSLAVSLLDPDSLQELSDVIRSPPLDRKYENLRATILDRFSDSADRQLLPLLTQLELGDRRPSQLLRQMRTLASSRVSEDVIRVKWLDLLPVGVQRILKVLKSHGLEELAAAADELLESGPGVMSTDFRAPQPSCAASSTACAAVSSSRSDVATELAAIRVILGRMMTLQQDILYRLCTPASGDPPRSSSRGRSRPRARTPASGGNLGICHYHRRWGADTQRCVTPCAFRATVSASAPGN